MYTLLLRVCFLSLLAFLGVLYPYSRGSLCTALVLSYILTSVVGGFTATSFQSQFTETGSVLNLLILYRSNILCDAGYFFHFSVI